MSSHPRREKSPSSLLLLLLVRTNFPSVPLNFVPRLSWLAIEVFCDSRLFEEITPCLPSFPPCDVRIVKGDRIVVRCAVFESRNESMFFGGGGFRSLFVANDARYMKHDIYIYMYGYIGGPRGRGTWSRRAMRDHRGWTRLFSWVELAWRREREKGWVPRGMMRSGVKGWRGLYLEAEGTYWIELNGASYGEEIRSLPACCNVSSIEA